MTSWTRISVLALALALASAHPARAQDVLVKTTERRIEFGVYKTDGTGEKLKEHLVGISCDLTDFPPVPERGVSPSPYVYDPGHATGPVFFAPSECPWKDWDGDGYQEFRFYARFDSLYDVGWWHLTCNGYHVDPTDTVVVERDSYGTPTKWVPCCTFNAANCPPVSCNDVCYRPLDPSASQLYLHAYNQVPVADDIRWEPQTPTCPGSVTLSSSGSDPDGGTVNFRWSGTGAGGTSIPISGTSSSTFVALNDAAQVGTVSIGLNVEDDEGELSSGRTRSFTVVPGQFTLTINGAPSVPVLRVPIELRATTNACGSPETTWDLVESPPRAHLQPGDAVHVGPSLVVATTTDQDIGRWVFRATAVLGKFSATQNYVVEVTNLPPRLELSSTNHIMVGETLRVATGVLQDDDGGALTFDWKLVQAPASAGVTPGRGFSSTASITIPTNAASAGTWIFELSATDDDGQANSTVFSDPVTVLVDALPEAAIVAPEYAKAWTSIVLDGSGSRDADSPCESDPMRCHVTAGGPTQAISEGIVAHAWYVTPPLELWGRYFPGRVEEALGIDGSQAILVVDDLEPGDWIFELVVRDGEGHTAQAQTTVTVLPPDVAPVVALSPPARYVVGIDGRSATAIGVSGAGSFDPDNLFSPGSGSGISAYRWTFGPPPGCGYVPASQDGASAVSLFAAGAVVAPECQGVWLVGLTITDDDQPALTASSSTEVVIGNCTGAVCIDSPTSQSPRIVEAWDHTDVMILYHVDSALYDRPELAYGMMTRLDVFLTGDRTAPVYSSWDPNVDLGGKGGLLTFNWNGFSSLGAPVVTGYYDVRVQLLDWSGTVISEAVTDTQLEAIWMEVADVRTALASDRYASRSDLASGASQVSVAYAVTGALTVDAIRWRVLDGVGHEVRSELVVGSLTGTIWWDGIANAAVVSPGHYTLELDAYRNGQRLGTSAAVPVTVYSLHVASAGKADGDVVAWVNTDDDDLNGVRDADEAPSEAEDDITGITFVVAPPLAGTLTITSSAPSGASVLWKDAHKDNRIALPWTADIEPGAPLPTAFIEALAPARAIFDLRFITADGVALKPVAAPLDQVEVRVLATRDSIEPVPATSLEIGRWDHAYEWSTSTIHNTPERNLIELDPRRFYVEIVDPGAGDPATPIRPQDADRWVTVETRGRVQDAPVRITLQSVAGVPGTLRSTSHLLVTEDHLDPRLDPLDPKLATDDAFAVVGNSAPIPDGAPDDRTHQADLSGTVRVAYRRVGAGADHAVQIPVCRRGSGDERRRATLQPVVFMNPMTSQPSVEESFVQEEIRRAVLSWQQACIQVVARPTIFVDAPVDASGMNILADGYLDPKPDVGIVHNAWKGNNDVQYVFFVPDFRDMPSGTLGFTVSPDVNPWLENDTMVFLRFNEADHRIRALAHELGHVLENGSRDTAADRVRAEFYPATGVQPDVDVLSTRRITEETEILCRRRRQTPTEPGNVLLKPY